jgi:hypothetical protein
MKSALASLVAVCGLLAPAAALAHHSFGAEYDEKKPVTLKGAITKVEWTNPHVHFYLDIKDDKGNVTNWNLELTSPNVLVRNGWSRHTLNVGDQVSVEGSLAKDGSQMANARAVTLSDGKKLYALPPSDEPPAQ